MYNLYFSNLSQTHLFFLEAHAATRREQCADTLCPVAPTAAATGGAATLGHYQSDGTVRAAAENQLGTSAESGIMLKKEIFFKKKTIFY